MALQAFVLSACWVPHGDVAELSGRTEMKMIKGQIRCSKGHGAAVLLCTLPSLLFLR